MDSYNIWAGIFSSIEKTDFAKWVKTLPKKMVKEIIQITKQKNIEKYDDL